MYTDEELEQLEEKEHSHAVETFALILLILSNLHSDLEKLISTFYRKYGKDGVVTYVNAHKWVGGKDHRKRINVLRGQITDLVDEVFSDFEDNMRSHLSFIVDTEGDWFDVDLDIDDILNTPWGIEDGTWLDNLYGYYDLWLPTINGDLKQSLLRRDTLDDILEALDKRFTSMEKVLWKMYTTQSTAVGSIARREVFKELGIKKYRFYAREDERTCEECGSLHGLTFPISAFEIGVTASPIHHHCRCWEVPIVD